MNLRVAVFACPCCGGSSNVLLEQGRRAPSRKACPNGGCWSCLGACHGMATRTEVLHTGRRRATAPAAVPGGGPVAG